MTALHWARLKAECPYPLRRGAWYRVQEFERHEVMLDVQWRTVSVPRSCIEVSSSDRFAGPWYPPRDAVRLPVSWGRLRTASVPTAATWVSLEGRPTS